MDAPFSFACTPLAMSVVDGDGVGCFASCEGNEQNRGCRHAHLQDKDRESLHSIHIHIHSDSNSSRVCYNYSHTHTAAEPDLDQIEYT
jgi:hypothetical protein